MKIDETKYGYIYRMTNLINGKTYIGQHKIKKDEKFLDYMGSGRLIRYAIHKYGKSNFNKDIIKYADSKKDLDILEKKYIHEELLHNKAEYNIENSDSTLQLKFQELLLNDEDLLEWYFDKKMSYKDISVKLGCSEPSIYNYMKKFRDTDERFSSIKHGSNRGKGGFTEESRKKAIETNRQKITCENCNRVISHSGWSNHIKVCNNEKYKYINGYKKHKCAANSCENWIFVKNVHCKDHSTRNHSQDTKNLK